MHWRNTYVAGATSSTDFPTVNAIQPVRAGGTDTGDGFVLKVNPEGSALIYSTYLGGSDQDQPFGMTADGTGNVYVAGQTSSRDFPTVNPLKPAHGPEQFDGFVAKMNAAGSALVYSTYFGGSNGDRVIGVAADAEGNAYLIGVTGSLDFPTVNALQPSFGGSYNDAFVSKLNPAGSALVYSTYLGGGGDRVQDLGVGIAVDVAGDAYVVGRTSSPNFPTANAVQPLIADDTDAFVAKITGRPLPGMIGIAPVVGTQGTTIPVTITGMNFIAGSTTVQVSGSGVAAGPVLVSTPQSLSTTFTIDTTARLDVRDVTVTTPQGTSNRLWFTIVSSAPGCGVSLPVRVGGTPADANFHYGIGAREPTTGTWALGFLYYNGTGVSIHGVALSNGPFIPNGPPPIYWTHRLQTPPILGVVNLFYNPDLCAYELSLTPGVSPSAEAGIRSRLNAMVGGR